MDERLIEYYQRELQFIRDMGGEFAADYPKIAGRLGLDAVQCTDPYVERLLEGFAFLAARVQLKLDAEFPQFTEQLLQSVYPDYLAPTPSMAMVSFKPDLGEGALADGFTIPRHTSLLSLTGKGDTTACEYRTAHQVELWPLKLVDAEYLGNLSSLGKFDTSGLDAPPVAGIRLSLEITANLKANELSLDRLPFYLSGKGPIAHGLYEQIFGNAVGYLVIEEHASGNRYQIRGKDSIERVGFGRDEALLPYSPRSFSGYRLLHEYFAFPQRFLSFALKDLNAALRQTSTSRINLVVLLSRKELRLETRVSAEDFAIHCAPAINLFTRKADRIHLDENRFEYHIVPDRTRQLDFEVYQVTRVLGFGESTEPDVEFSPFYYASDGDRSGRDNAFYTLHRTPRVLSSKERRTGPRSSYSSGEVYLSLVDRQHAPFSRSLRQLAVETLCTNRDLALQIPIGQTETDFNLNTGAPVEAIKCLSGPTRPTPSPAYQRGELVWRLINQLQLNYLSITDDEAADGGTKLADLLSIYSDLGGVDAATQLAGILSVKAEQVVRRMPVAGPIAFGRGLEITLTCSEQAFEGAGLFLFGAVMEEFFARYVSINSFTETVIRSPERGEIMRWPTRIGRRPLM